ncbi:MAG: sigma-70 family RNA polymerase sigma factor [Planctomycetota bacterium]|jgi:RNA polymerase sigma-70 factor (ECF subfamily)
MDETRSTLLVRLRDPADQTAWRRFDRLYRPMIVGYARARGLGHADAEDIAQQCVEAVLRQIGRYQHLGSFRSWLRTVTERRICDLFRRHRERQADSGLWSARFDASPGPVELWEQHWWRAHFRHCVEQVRGQVHESTYTAFTEYSLRGKTAEETAATLGLSVSQVYVAKHRVLERIRAMVLELTGTDVTLEEACYG